MFLKLFQADFKGPIKLANVHFWKQGIQNNAQVTSSVLDPDSGSLLEVVTTRNHIVGFPENREHVGVLAEVGSE